jgi:hypothetical protein
MVALNHMVSCTLQGGKARRAHGSDDDSDEDFGAARKAPKKKAAPKKAEVRRLITSASMPSFHSSSCLVHCSG